MMGFRVGDKVVHPSHGAGVICGIETHAINQDASSSYYVISLMSAGSRRVLVPVNNVIMIGLRSAMARSKASEVLEVLNGRPAALSNNFTERQAHLSEHLRSGDPREWAELVRNLYWRGLKKKLSATDQDYYNRARDMLAGEIALADGCTIEAAGKRIEDRLRVRFGNQ
jgi:CarD family transcriptional regulator, regulator of rRNA transcription